MSEQKRESDERSQRFAESEQQQPRTLIERIRRRVRSYLKK
jgi:hypothetical protein